MAYLLLLIISISSFENKIIPFNKAKDNIESNMNFDHRIKVIII